MNKNLENSTVQSDTINSEIDILVIDIEGIMKAIPHRYPFLLIDRVVGVKLGSSATGIKNVTVNDQFFIGHFPGSEFEGKLVYFMTVDSAKFRKPVVPGDQLHIHVEKERNRANVWKFRGIAKVNGVSVAEAIFSAMLVG